MNRTIQNRLRSRKERVYRALDVRLKNGAHARLSYDEIALEIGCARSTVSYHIRKFLKQDLVKIDNQGKLYIPATRRKS